MSQRGRLSAAVGAAIACVLACGALSAPAPAAPVVAVMSDATSSTMLAATEVGDLTYQGCFKRPGGSATCAGTNNGLAGAHAVAMSPDGKSVYATGHGDNTVSMFTRDPATGALTPAGCVTDADLFPGTAGCTDFEEGMAEPFGIAVSPDGLDVYVAGQDDSAITHFERDPVTGNLTGAGCIADTGDFAGCGGATQNGLEHPFSLVVAPDGSAVYVAGGRALVRLVRNTTTGALSPGSCLMGTGDSIGCGTQHDGIGDLYDLAVSADGTSLHTVSRNGGAVFSFSPGFGSAGCFYDSDNAPIGGCAATQGLAAARGVAVSPDGKSAYVVSGANSALVPFERGPTGVLAPVGCIGDVGTAACPATAQGLGSGVDVTVSADNASVYAVTEDGGGAIVSFSRNTTTGALTARGCISQVVDSAGCPSDEEGLFQPRGVIGSPDAKSVYVSSFGQDAIARFDRVAGAVAPLPPNEVKVRTKKVTCTGACRKVKVKIVTPPKTGGRLAVCYLDPAAKFCPGWKGRASGDGRAARSALVKTKFVNVTGGKVVVKLKTTRRARALLAQKGFLKLKLRIDFEPSGGVRSSMKHKIRVTLV
ncbi:lactonase family protein [Nocardioides dilutus]